MTTFLSRPLGLLTALLRQKAGSLLYLLTLAALPAVAQAPQDLTLRGVPVPPQVLPLDGQGYAVLYRSEAGEEGQDVYAMRILDPALKVKHQYALNIPVGAVPLATLPARNTFALVFQDRTTARVALYTFNPGTGAKQQRILEALPDGRRAPAGAPLVATTPTEGYCLVQPYRADTAGYAITILDANLKPEWTHMYFPKDLRQHQPLQVAVSKDVITLVLSDSYILNRNKPTQRYMTDYAVLGIDRATGKVLYRTPTRQNGLTMLPNQLLPLADGRVATTGVYFTSKATRLDSAQGVFLTTYKPDGTAAAPVLTPWAELGKAVNDPGLGVRVQARKAYFPLLELVTTTGTDAKLIGEYNDNGQPGPFVVLNYDATGKLANIYPVARTFKSVSTADELRYSHYRGVVGKQGEPYLLYTGVESKQEYAYATVLANVPGRSAVRAVSSLEKLPDAPAAPAAFVDPVAQHLELFRKNLNTAAEAVNKALYGDTPPPQTYYQNDPLTGFVVGAPGEVATFRYDPARKQMRLRVLPMQ
ncbi:hypothetical protein F0P96_11280 [Hymenobacter busanensis]|uniref:Uncharacterized protein n=1 Tax=Hymenobacter busanensis TaxID=2607656 RepID=A0A7L4ZX43_9BACT|nr:hypothetical protein [Hymenobacter busanensis]KAA9332065.1 hypothetical protein F0P96_11280 [Hymenobacter busanensis]QHJ07597.1 hypothetical protein GUY19_09995 [Hymenobacter busanensis]